MSYVNVIARPFVGVRIAIVVGLAQASRPPPESGISRQV